MSSLAATTDIASVPAANEQRLREQLADPSLPEQYRDAIANFLTQPVAQIADGIKANAGDAPWQVSLGVKEIDDPRWAHYCAGVLYKPDWVITAAHCVRNMTKDDVLVVVGVTTLQKGIPRLPVDSIFINPGYDPIRRNNDVAVLHLSSSVNMTAVVRPIDIVSDTTEGKFSSQRTLLNIAGWGTDLAIGGIGVPDLQIASVHYQSPMACTKPLSYPTASSGEPQITSQMMCAGEQGGGPAACHGDSGGGLIFFEHDRPMLVGIDSWDGPCGAPYKYNVFARMTQFRNWVESYTKQAAK